MQIIKNEKKKGQRILERGKSKIKIEVKTERVWENIKLIILALFYYYKINERKGTIV